MLFLSSLYGWSNEYSISVQKFNIVLKKFKMFLTLTSKNITIQNNILKKYICIFLIIEISAYGGTQQPLKN